MSEVRVRCGPPDLGDFSSIRGTPILVDEETGKLYVMLVSGVISECCPHIHNVADIGGLVEALNGKSDTHGHPYADQYHGHNINEISGLPGALANLQQHAEAQHAPIDAQKNADITKDEIEAKLIGVVSSHSHPGGSGPEFKSGIAFLNAGGNVNVMFATAFSSTPRVTVTSQFNNADTSCSYSAHSVTVNGFTLRGAGNPAGNVAWIATNADNT